MIHERGAAHAGQRDTRQDPGARRGLWCYRSEVVIIEVVTLIVLSALTHPFQRDTGILARTPVVELCLYIVWHL
jgi:hypothetical protein